MNTVFKVSVLDTPERLISAKSKKAVKLFVADECMTVLPATPEETHRFGLRRQVSFDTARDTARFVYLHDQENIGN